MQYFISVQKFHPIWTVTNSSYLSLVAITMQWHFREKIAWKWFDVIVVVVFTVLEFERFEYHFTNTNIPDWASVKIYQKIECRNHFPIDQKILFLCHTQIKTRDNQILEFYACNNCQNDRHFLNSKFILRIGIRLYESELDVVACIKRKRK